MNIRVVLVDDQTLVRAGFRSLLDNTEGIEVVGVASDGAEAVDVVRAARPHVVLMDIRMPHVDGIEATRTITEDPALADVRVLVLTTFDLDDLVFEALQAGASGFLLKDVEPDDLRKAVKIIAEGASLLSPQITRRLIAEFVTRRKPVQSTGPSLNRITDREREVMALVGAGLSNEEIANRLYISASTAKTHVSHVMIKLHARDRAQLVVMAYESGLVTPGNT